MPKIQVYKNEDAMIPVEEAKKTSAYRCPWTKKIHQTKASYVKHLTNLRKTRMHVNARRKRHSKLGEEFWNQPSFEDIISWIETHPDWFVQPLRHLRFFVDPPKNSNSCAEYEYFQALENTVIKVTYLDLRWSESCSNSHSCPHNGKRNWGGRDNNIPCGYPGWTGRFEYQVLEPPGLTNRGYGFDLFRGCRINYGSGGGRGEGRYGFGVTFFLDDWPGLKKNIDTKRTQWERQSTIDILKNSYHDFEAPDIKYGSPVYFR